MSDNELNYNDIIVGSFIRPPDGSHLSQNNDVPLITHVPTIDDWISALSIAYTGEQLSLTHLIPKMSKKNVGGLTSDISYYKTKNLSAIARSSSEEEIYMIADSIRAGNSSLKDYHTCSGEVVYYDFRKANGVINVLEPEENVLIHDDVYFYDDKPMNASDYQLKFDEAKEQTDEEVSEIVPKIFNGMLVKAAEKGIFSEMTFLSRASQDPWVNYIRDYGESKEKARVFENKFSTSGTVIRPRLNDLQAITENMKFEKGSTDQKINGLGYMSPNSVILALQDLRFHVTSARGRSRFSLDCFNEVFERLHDRHQEDLVVFLPNPDKFRPDIQCTKVADYSRFYDVSRRKLICDPPPVVLFSQNFQMDLAQRFGFINALLRSESKVFWVANYSQLKSVKGGIVVADIYQFSPLYDLVCLCFVGRLFPNEFRDDVYTEIIYKCPKKDSTVITDILAYPISKKVQFVKILTRDDLTLFRKCFVLNYFEYLVKVFTDPGEMFNKINYKVVFKDRLGLANMSVKAQAASVSLNDNQIVFLNEGGEDFDGGDVTWGDYGL